MPDIAFMTYIHNGEKTMRKSIESVLNQESVDLVYYLIDNASTDSTWDIMQEYAAKDGRVRLIQNENSLVRLPEYIKSIKDCEYFAVLDADDWYEPAFAREAIAFAREEDLDIVVVGVCHHAGEKTDVSMEKESMTVMHDEFGEHMELFSQYFRTMWGKVFKLSVVHKVDFTEFDKLAERKMFYAIDMVFSLSAVRVSQRVGVFNQVLHHYLILPESDSSRYHPDRFYAVTVGIKMWMEMFVKDGVADDKNFRMTIVEYYRETVIIFQILMRTKIDIESFLKEVRIIAAFPMTNVCTQQYPALKELIVGYMIDKIEGMENDPEIVQLFYECLKALDAVELFKKMAK